MRDVVWTLYASKLRSVLLPGRTSISAQRRWISAAVLDHKRGTCFQRQNNMMIFFVAADFVWQSPSPRTWLPPPSTPAQLPDLWHTRHNLRKAVARYGHRSLGIALRVQPRIRAILAVSRLKDNYRYVAPGSATLKERVPPLSRKPAMPQ